MHYEFLRELTQQEWEYRDTIVKELSKNLKKSTNLFGALYPFKVKGLVFYLLDYTDKQLFDLLMQISDLVILPIPPTIELDHIMNIFGNLDNLLTLWNKQKILPMLTFPYESYSNKDFLDPLLENRPPCGAVRSRILLEFLAGDYYDDIADIEQNFVEYMPASFHMKKWIASILTELRVLGYNSIAQISEYLMCANLKSGIDFAWNVARLLTVPIVSGFGAVPQYRYLTHSFYVRTPWSETTEYPIAYKILSGYLEPSIISYNELKQLLLKLDEAAKKGNSEEILRISSKIHEFLHKDKGLFKISIYMTNCPQISKIKWRHLLLLLWELEKPKNISLEMKRKKKFALQSSDNLIKEVRPGDPVSHPLGFTGTLTAFALDNYNRIVPIISRHVITAGFTSRYSYFFIGEPIDNVREIVFNFRIRGLDEELPAVLKKPIQPRRGMKIIMVGWRSGIKRGTILEERLPPKPFEFYIQNTRFSINGDTLFTARLGAIKGDSGALVLSEDGRFPVGMVVASNIKDQSVTFCHRLIDICPRHGIKGIFCPIGLPRDSSLLLREIVASLIPDGIFEQSPEIISKTEKQVLGELGIQVEEDIAYYGNIKSKKELLKGKVRIGEKVLLRGKIVLNEKGKIIGIAFAKSENTIIVMPLERIKKALCLKLIR